MRTLDDILKRAREELRINPSITVYTFDNGVEKRRPANPWIKFNQALREANISFKKLRDSIQETAFKFSEFNQWADDESRRRRW